jgi:2-polyprenyl-3-methyl-5-hydroxy-6-metoxy-1,4-benzoquinol methylase
MRRVFWQRLRVLNYLMNRHLTRRKSCLDFGGGSGVMLPTLSRKVDRLTLVDLEARQARLVQERFELKNVDIIQGDIAELDFCQRPFDGVVAADVLEHFQDLRLPVQTLRNWLQPDGRLFTSLPTENWVYVGLRKVFGVEKPWDHYHTGYEVEAFLAANGFEKVQTIHVPFTLPLAPLFLVSAWKLKDGKPTPP